MTNENLRDVIHRLTEANQMAKNPAEVTKLMRAKGLGQYMLKSEGGALYIVYTRKFQKVAGDNNDRGIAGDPGADFSNDFMIRWANALTLDDWWNRIYNRVTNNGKKKIPGLKR